MFRADRKRFFLIKKLDFHSKNHELIEVSSFYVATYLTFCNKICLVHLT